jgi:hypothetical protein
VSVAAATGSTGLPIVNQATEPEWVRKGSPDTQKAYESALSFEETLVEQISKTLTSTSDLSGESEGESGSEEGSGGNSALSSMLPQALTTSVMDAGGLGLAAEMTRNLQGVDSASQTQTTGGASA